MPGFVGIFHKDLEPINLALFDSMISVISHRHIYTKTLVISPDNRYALANISLPTLNSERQPFVSHDEKIKILMHGELYNEEVNEFNQLAYIYELYRTFDLKFPQHLNGSFLIFILDEQKKRVVIANDRTASRPLFYLISAQGLYCAPELKALLLVPHLRREINPSAVASFLSCGYLINGETWVEDVKTLDNATLLVFSAEGVHFHKYWNFMFHEDAKDLGAECYQEILSDLILKAVRNRIRTSHKYGILLSGGYDSRAILGCVLREKNCEEIKTISWGNREDIADSDCVVARRLAKKVGVHHTFYELDEEKFPKHAKDFIYLSDALTDACGNYPESLKIFERIREELGVEVLLRGDECFGWLATAFDEKSMFETVGIYRLNEISGFQKIIGPDKMAIFGAKIDHSINTLSQKIALRRIHNRKDFFYLDQRLKCYLNPLSYVKRIEIELRNPFIDNNIMDFLVELPEKYRIRKSLYVSTIRKMFPEIFTEMAFEANLLGWERQLDESMALKRFLEEEFAHDTAEIYRIIDFRRFKEFRDGNRKQGFLRRHQDRWSREYPGTYKAMKYIQACLSKKTGRMPMGIGRGVIMRRVLTLKIWCDLFLNGNPVPETGGERVGRVK